MGLLKTNVPPFQDGISKAAFPAFAQAGRQFSVLTYWKYALRAKTGCGLSFGMVQDGTGRTLLQSSGHALLNRPEASDIQCACGPICPWELLLFNTPLT